VITHDEIKAAGGNDVGDWGEKDIRGAYSGPLNIAGERVDVDQLPPFGDNAGSAECPGGARALKR
jgi:hypothetical protein